MTKISYIHGPEQAGAKKRKRPQIGAGETAQRAAEVPAQGAYIPYNSMTRGEMHLALMLQQANILADYYKRPEYRDAAAMLENALYGGIHGTTVHFGRVNNPTTTSVSRAINAARRDTRPATRGGIIGRGKGIGSGIHIGDPVIPYETRLRECQLSAGASPGAQAACINRMELEKILNDGMERCGLYLAYGFLPNDNRLPQIASGKIREQLAAQQELARVGAFSEQLVQEWLNVGMMRNNAAVAQLEPYDWIDTNSYLMMLPAAGVAEVKAILAQSGNLKRLAMDQGASLTAIRAERARKIADVLLRYKNPDADGVGVVDPITAAVAIIGAITALIGGISAFAQELRVKKQDAFAAARAFGARALGAEEEDWNLDGIPDAQQTTTGGTGLPMPLLLGGAAVVGAYFLLRK